MVNFAEVVGQAAWDALLADDGIVHVDGAADLAVVGRTVVAAWREVCTIRTVEQLDALPEGAVIRWDRGAGVDAQVLERGVGDWFEPGTDSSEPHGPHLVPALLLWHPGWET